MLWQGQLQARCGISMIKRIGASCTGGQVTSRALPNWQATAVDDETGHVIAIVRAGHEGFHLYDGNSMTVPHTTRIEHPQGRSWYSLDEIRQMFATRKLSILEG